MKRSFAAAIQLAIVFALISAPAFASEPLELKTVEFYGESVGRTMKFNIVLPADYETSGKQYPVLYLLHGLTSNYLAWGGQGVPEYAAAYDLIVVMPDGGNSWYVNWAESKAGQKNAWEDHITKDVVGYVDSNYRTIARREGRAINGLSMGGFGALTIGLRNPDMFCSIGSHSGALAYARQMRSSNRVSRPGRDRPNPRIGLEDFDSQAERTPSGTIFTSPEQADAYDPFKIVLDVPKDKLPHIYLDCGTEDGLIRSAREFAGVLMANDIPFTFAQSPGGHNRAYWTREVAHSMAAQYLVIQRNLKSIDN